MEFVSIETAVSLIILACGLGVFIGCRLQHPHSERLGRKTMLEELDRNFRRIDHPLPDYAERIRKSCLDREESLDYQRRGKLRPMSPRDYG